MSRENWIARGDRSHPNLVRLDSLSLSYDGWESDVTKAENAHMSLPMEFKERMFEIEEKQKMHQGDRSHPRLQELDSLQLTYMSWERDFAKAEEYHVALPDLFRGKIAGMKEKQKIYEGDRSHSNLVALDGLLQLSYPGYRDDVCDAEDIHTSKPFLFSEKLSEIKEKQRMHEGDRNHPRLVALDKLNLTYPNWVRDVKKAEEYHVRFPELFFGKLTGMSEKEKMHSGDRSHPNLVQLDSLRLTYPNWREDFKKAEEAHTHIPLEFKSILFEIKEKQKMFQGNRSHSRLVALDREQFSYPGFERDLAKVEEYHVRYPELFPGKLAGMKEKQRIYAGDSSTSSFSSSRSSTLLLGQTSNSGDEDSDEFWEDAADKSLSDMAATNAPKNQSQLGECIVCLKDNKTHAFVPCGHLCVCQNCVPMMMLKRKCPICRQRATQVIKVFFS